MVWIMKIEIRRKILFIGNNETLLLYKEKSMRMLNIDNVGNEIEKKILVVTRF